MYLRNFPGALLFTLAIAAPHDIVKRQDEPEIPSKTSKGTVLAARTVRSPDSAITAVVKPRADDPSTKLPNRASAKAVERNVKDYPSLSGWDYSNPSVAFPASGTWTAVQCDATGLVSTLNTGAQQWEAAEAWQQTLDAWNTPGARQLPTGQDQTFSDFVWNVFHSTPGSNCQDVLNNVCDTPLLCNYNQKATPAASLIMNSMVFLHSAVNHAWAVIDQAKSAFDITGFVNTFADPITAHDITVAKEIVDIVAFASVAITAGAVNFMFKPAAEARGISEATKGNLADLTYAVAGYATAAAKDNFPAADGPGIESFFNSAIAYLYNSTKQSEAGFLLGVMGAGSKENQTQLSNMMMDGNLLDLEHSPPTYSQDLAHNMSKLITGALIPVAWGISPKGFKPFILKVPKDDFDCKNLDAGQHLPGQTGDTISSIFYDASHKKARWCDPDGNSWFLLSGSSHSNPANAVSPGSNTVTATFDLLAGGDKETLDGSAYQGIQIQDFIVSSYTGFLQNGNKNGFESQKPSTLTAHDDMTVTPPPDNQATLPYNAGIRAPGFYNITICLDWREAYNTLQAQALQTSDGAIQSMPICGEYPQTNVQVGKAADFTPGQCIVSVEQWQRNEVTVNPTPNFQISVTVEGNNGGVFASAAKQDASTPLVITDTDMPYNLIVKANGPNDDSPVEFWYSNQWWTSNDQAHKCDFKGYKGGSRTGTCNFDCPAPPADSATKVSASHAAPTNVKDALAGPVKLENNYAPTATGNSDPSKPDNPPKETGNFAGGNCTFHLSQWQRNEKDINPSNDYAVQVSIKDGKGKFVTDSGQIPSPEGKWTDIQGGGMPKPLDVKTIYGPEGNDKKERGDNGPIQVMYGQNQMFNLSNINGRCPGHTGKYDHGIRRTDCWFNC